MKIHRVIPLERCSMTLGPNYGQNENLDNYENACMMAARAQEFPEQKC